MVLYKNYDEALPVLQNWLTTQPHLPEILPNTLKTFIIVCDGDLEKSKKLIDSQYSMRNTYSHIFLERDPSDEGSEIILESYDMLALPNCDPNGNKIVLSRVNDPDPDKYLHTAAVKLFFMLGDARFAQPDFCKGDIALFDLNNYTLKHLTRQNLQTLRIFMKFIQEAINVKVCAIHVMNCPSYIDKVMTFMRPFISSELYSLIKFHQPNSETLYEFIPKDILPNEYGGKCGTLAELRKSHRKLLIENKDFLMNPKYWKVDESKRPANQERPDAMEGNFRRLDVD